MQNTVMGDLERIFEKSDGSSNHLQPRFGLAVYDLNTPLYYGNNYSLWDNEWNRDPNLPTDTTNWHHIVITVEHAAAGNISNVKIYRDGVLRNSGQGSDLFLNTQAFDYYIGKDFQGFVDDLRVYRKALTPQQVTTLFQLEGDNNNCLDN